MALIALSVAAQNAPGTQPSATEVVELNETLIVGQALQSDQLNALKTPTPIIDAPQSLSLTSAEDISLRGFDSVEDIVAYTPGVNISQGEGHRDAVVFRGVRSTADFFVDGVRDDVQYYRPLYNIEQVEILRGPNALLFDVAVPVVSSTASPRKRKSARTSTRTPWRSIPLAPLKPRSIATLTSATPARSASMPTSTPSRITATSPMATV